MLVNIKSIYISFVNFSLVLFNHICFIIFNVPKKTHNRKPQTPLKEEGSVVQSAIKTKSEYQSFIEELKKNKKQTKNRKRALQSLVGILTIAAISLTWLISINNNTDNTKVLGETENNDSLDYYNWTKKQYNKDLNPLEDEDNDGVNNYQEFLQGTDIFN